jgi:hypothetical protein
MSYDKKRRSRSYLPSRQDWRELGKNGLWKKRMIMILLMMRRRWNTKRSMRMRWKRKRVKMSR